MAEEHVVGSYLPTFNSLRFVKPGFEKNCWVPNCISAHTTDVVSTLSRCSGTAARGDAATCGSNVRHRLQTTAHHGERAWVMSARDVKQSA